MGTVYGDLYDATLQKLTKHRFDLASELNNIDKAIDALKTLTNGKRVEEQIESAPEPAKTAMGKYATRKLKKSAIPPVYDQAVKNASSNAIAAVTIMRTLKKPVSAGDIEKEFKRVGRPATAKTVRAILAHLKEAKRVKRGLYTLK